MRDIRHIPSLGNTRADGAAYMLRNGRECASPHDLIMGMRRAAERAQEEQLKGSIYGVQPPSLIKLRLLRETLFEIALDKAFLIGCRALSIGQSDLIADDSRVITSNARSFFPRYTSWALADFLGVGAGCGNGRGEGVYQYQIHSFYFDESKRGVWNTTTGERLRDAFSLNDRLASLHDFYATLYNASEIRKYALEYRTKPKVTSCEAAHC